MDKYQQAEEAKARHGWLNPACIGCYYYRGESSLKTCMYWEIEDHLRPCPPWEACTVRKEEARDMEKEARQRYERGERIRKELHGGTEERKAIIAMWQEGGTTGEIARALGLKIEHVEARLQSVIQSGRQKYDGKRYKVDPIALMGAWKEGKTKVELAEEFKLSRSTIDYYIKKWHSNGIFRDKDAEWTGKAPRRSASKHKNLDIEQFHDDWKAGMSWDELCSKHGVGIDTVKYHVRKWRKMGEQRCQKSGDTENSSK